MIGQSSARSEYASFVVDVEPRLRHALIGSFGLDVARDATADALAYGWEHWERLSVMDNPAGYLYRVAQTSARRNNKANARFPLVPVREMPWVEPGLPRALESLSERQRAVVWAIYGLGWKPAEIAELMDLSPETVRTHAKRGMEKLRQELGGQS